MSTVNIARFSNESGSVEYVVIDDQELTRQGLIKEYGEPNCNLDEVISVKGNFIGFPTNRPLYHSI